MKEHQAGRGLRGRFVKGNPGGPGRPRRTAAVESDYLQAFSAGCPPETMRLIGSRMATKALGGDVKAAELVLRYLAGRPRPEALTEIAAVEAAGFDPGAPWEMTEAALVAVIAASPDPEAQAWLSSRDPDGRKRRSLGIATP
jgi:hypothetical protein